MTKKITRIFLVSVVVFSIVLGASTVLASTFYSETDQGYVGAYGGHFNNFYPLTIRAKLQEAYVWGTPAGCNIFVRRSGGPTYYNDIKFHTYTTSWYSPGGTFTMCDYINPYAADMYIKGTSEMYID